MKLQVNNVISSKEYIAKSNHLLDFTEDKLKVRKC